MAAIVRVKRKISEDPADALVLHCKRLKYEAGEAASNEEPEDGVQSMLRFAGTVSNKVDVSKQIRDAIRKEKLEKEFKQHAVNVQEKARALQKTTAETSRFQVISSRRALDLESLNTTQDCDKEKSKPQAKSDTHSKVFCLYDVEPKGRTAAEGADSSQEDAKEPSGAEPVQETIMCNNVPMVRKKVEPTDNYVYDLYFTNSRDFDFRLLENILSVEAFNQELQFGDYRDEDCQVYDDDEDSNDEGNWRNDYPEEDPRFIENGTAEYEYGQDGCVGFDDDEEKISGLLHSRCILGDDESDEGAESDDDEDKEYSNHLWAPKNSFEKYKAMVLKELEEDYKEDL